MSAGKSKLTNRKQHDSLNDRESLLSSRISKASFEDSPRAEADMTSTYERQIQSKIIEKFKEQISSRKKSSAPSSEGEVRLLKSRIEYLETEIERLVSQNYTNDIVKERDILKSQLEKIKKEEKLNKTMKDVLTEELKRYRNYKLYFYALLVGSIVLTLGLVVGLFVT